MKEPTYVPLSPEAGGTASRLYKTLNRAPVSQFSFPQLPGVSSGEVEFLLTLSGIFGSS